MQVCVHTQCVCEGHAVNTVVVRAGWGDCRGVRTVSCAAVKCRSVGGMSATAYKHTSTHNTRTQVSDGMSRVAGILDVHDLHVWNISTGIPVLTAHVHIGEDADPNQVRFRLNLGCPGALDPVGCFGGLQPGALGRFAPCHFRGCWLVLQKTPDSHLYMFPHAVEVDTLKFKPKPTQVLPALEVYLHRIGIMHTSRTCPSHSTHSCTHRTAGAVRA